MRRLVFPARMKIDVHDIGEGKTELEYTEWPSEELPKESMEYVRRIMEETFKATGIEVDYPDGGIKFNEDGSIHIKLVGERDGVYNVLAGEFILNSAIGGLTLADLLLLSGERALEMRKREQLRPPSVVPSGVRLPPPKPGTPRAYTTSQRKIIPIGKGEDLGRKCPRCGEKGVEFIKIMRAPPPYEKRYSISLWCPSCKRSMTTTGNFVYTVGEVEKPTPPEEPLEEGG